MSSETMKIYILPVDELPKPKIRPWPVHSTGFTMEIDFLNFLKQSNLLTDSSSKADWHYLPINWTFWLLANDYGRANRDLMQASIDNLVIDANKTFTVTEAGLTPANFNVGKMVIFSANQQTKGEIPIPLLSRRHRLPREYPDVRYLSSFVGSIKHWPMRREMNEVLKDRDDVLIVERKTGEEFFVNSILSSSSVLCPRGSADSSYRFYEAMQLGRVPIMINEVDFRPFPDHIHWDSCSYYVDSPSKLPALLDSLDKKELLHKGANAKEVWYSLVSYGWCDMLLDCL